MFDQNGYETEQPQSRDVRIVGVVTRKTFTPSSVRHIALLPYFAIPQAMERAKALCDIIERHPSRGELRYCVLHPDTPTDADGLADSLEAINSNIVSFSKAVRRHGGHMVWISIEAHYQLDGLFHVHANIIFDANGKSMSKISRMSNRKFGRDGWHDSGVIRNASNVASYITKAPDLRNAKSREVIAYHEATEPRQLHRRAQNIPQVEDTDDVDRTQTESEEHQVETHQHLSIAEPPCGSRVDDAPNCRKQYSSTDRAVSRNVGNPIENRILRDLGMRFLSNHAEPALLVEGYTEQPITDAGRLGLEFIRRKALSVRASWINRGGDPGYFSCHKESDQNWPLSTSYRSTSGLDTSHTRCS